MSRGIGLVARLCLCGVAAFLVGVAAVWGWVPEEVAVGVVLAVMYLAVTLIEDRLYGRGDV